MYECTNENKTYIFYNRYLYFKKLIYKYDYTLYINQTFLK